MCKVSKYFFLTTIVCNLISCATAPLQNRSDALFAFNAAKKIQAVVCSPKKFYLSQKAMTKGDSYLSSKNFSDAEREYNRAREYAEKAEFDCLLKKEE